MAVNGLKNLGDKISTSLDNAADKFGEDIIGKGSEKVANGVKKIPEKSVNKAQYMWNNSKVGSKYNSFKRGYDKVKKANDGDSKKIRKALGKNFASTTFNKIKNTKFGQTAVKAIEKIKKIASFVTRHWILCLIIFGIIVILPPIIKFVIANVWSIGQNPHYYCEIEADDSLQKTSIYQQYCGKLGKSSLELTELNGHYVVQDGSGPCTDCAMLNMMMRYFTENGINFFDYMWQDNGEYLPQGNALNSSVGSMTVRRTLNGGSPESTSSTNSRKGGAKMYTHDSQQFAADHGKGNDYDMANWGYLFDDTITNSVDVHTNGFELDTLNSDKWVFDLSLPNKGQGTTWSLQWDQNVTIDGVTFTTVSEDGGSGERLKQLFSSPNECDATAGIEIYYGYDSSNPNKQHGVLITGYDEQTGYWNIIDSGEYLSGGYEGPMDGTGHFGIHDGPGQLGDLLSGKSSSFTLVKIIYCKPNANKR